MAVDIAGEGGEILDTAKKIAIYGQEVTPAHLANFIEELGDLEFYMEGLRQVLGVTREQVLHLNQTKLGRRYAGYAYSDAAAEVRKDKQ